MPQQALSSASEVLAAVVARTAADRDVIARTAFIFEEESPLATAIVSGATLANEDVRRAAARMTSGASAGVVILEQATGRVALRASPLQLAILVGDVSLARRLLRLDPNLAAERCTLALRGDEASELSAVQCVAFAHARFWDGRNAANAKRARIAADLVASFVELGIPVSERFTDTKKGDEMTQYVLCSSTKLSCGRREWAGCQTIHLAIEFRCFELLEAVLFEQPRAVAAPGHFRLGCWTFSGVTALHFAALKCAEDCDDFAVDVARTLLAFGADADDARCAYSWRVCRGAGVRLVRMSPAALLLLQLPAQHRAPPAALRFLDLLLLGDKADDDDDCGFLRALTASGREKRRLPGALRLEGALYEDFTQRQGATAFDDTEPSTVRVYDTLVHFAMFHCRCRAAVDRVAAATCDADLAAVASVLANPKAHAAPLFRVVQLRHHWARAWPQLRLAYLAAQDPHSLFSVLNDDTAALVRDFIALDPRNAVPSSCSWRSPSSSY
mmetsp:Transcript_30654/g.93682  ORF Transcript_30654/g.93682 Transcript_30654/m.93682 type:complete len:501 (+) Transcript_30654:61-1563(+)